MTGIHRTRKLKVETFVDTSADTISKVSISKLHINMFLCKNLVTFKKRRKIILKWYMFSLLRFQVDSYLEKHF